LIYLFAVSGLMAYLLFFRPTTASMTPRNVPYQTQQFDNQDPKTPKIENGGTLL